MPLLGTATVEDLEKELRAADDKAARSRAALLGRIAAAREEEERQQQKQRHAAATEEGRAALKSLEESLARRERHIEEAHAALVTAGVAFARIYDETAEAEVFFSAAARGGILEGGRSFGHARVVDLNSDRIRADVTAQLGANGFETASIERVVAAPVPVFVRRRS